jgi:hypothetical protein
MPQHIEDLFEDKARKGDGAFAIAFALMRLAKQQERTANALNRLGLADAATPMGAIEALGVMIKEGADRIASAIEEHSPD